MLTLLNLLSAIALLIWGTQIVRTGILRVYGSHLRKVLSQNVSKRPMAFAAGIGVTALVQSSNATALLVTSFGAQGRPGRARQPAWAAVGQPAARAFGVSLWR
jgi:phosphate:Na+ symporter